MAARKRTTTRKRPATRKRKPAEGSAAEERTESAAFERREDSTAKKKPATKGRSKLFGGKKAAPFKGKGK